MNKKVIIPIAIVLIIGAGFLINNYVGKNNLANNAPSKSENVQNSNNGQLKTFQIEAANFAYSLKEMRVKKGERVQIILNVKQGFHDLAIEGYGLNTQKLQAGGSQTLEFTADKAGRFEYYCSVGNHRQMGMTGTLVVE